MSNTPRISFEFFPPQTLAASFRVWETVQALVPMQPEFVSVTYGAGGTTRKLTHDAVATIYRNYGLNVAAHLTCVDATKAETLEIAEAYAAAGVTEVRHHRRTNRVSRAGRVRSQTAQSPRKALSPRRLPSPRSRERQRKPRNQDPRSSPRRRLRQRRQARSGRE